MSYEEALQRIALEDPRVLVLTAENRAPVRGLPARLGDRFIDVGIAEQTLVGMAAGLAHAGRVPVVHALAPFLTMRAFEFIRTDVGIGRLPVKLVGFIPGVLSDGNGPTHQSLEDIGLMRGIPGMQVFCPADVDELERALPALIAAEGPCYVRYTTLACERDVHDRDDTPGLAECCARGEDVTLLAFGALLAPAERARRELAARGLSVGLLNLRWLAPLDEAAIARAALESRALVSVEDHFVSHGLYPAVTEILHRRRIPTRVIPIGLERWFAAGTYADVLEHAGLSGPRIAARVLSALTQKES